MSAPVELGPGETLSMVPAVVSDDRNPAFMVEARQGSHDTLIRLAGNGRRSGVWWTLHKGDEALQVLTDIEFAAASQRHSVADRQMREMLADPSAALVVAWCKVTEFPEPTGQPPAARDAVFVCLSCHHWQVDVHPRAVSDAGGNTAAYRLAMEVHAEHLYGDCPSGPGGRIKVGDQWVERPEMASGHKADGVVAVQALPRWWVWR